CSCLSAMESLVHYSNPSHALSVLAVLNEQRLRGQMCDVVLVVADQRYQAHQSVLAASSEYFQSLFAQMDKETLKVVNLDFCEPDSFETVLNYIYTSSLFIDKGSLAAIQELGYSLGIPFLTNIVSTRPHASYCVSRKRLSFCEGEENDIQTRSVIVYRVPNDAAHGPRCVDPKKSELSPSSPNYTRELAQSQSDHGSSQLVKHSGSMYRSSPEDTETVESKSAYSYASILKGGSSKMTPVRPQLTSSVSFSEAEVEHNQLQSNAQADRRKENGEEAPYQTKVPVQGQASNSSHHIDRSGPLIKSLLRRSLSMDSPVPVFSPTLELRELRGREQSVVKLASKAAVPEASAHKDGAKTSPLMLRSKYQGRCDEESQVESQVSIKAEPSSPLADPMDIVRITVGETLPVSLRDLQANYDQGSRPQGTPPGKRYHRPMNRRYPLKKSKLNKEQPPSSPHSVGSERGAEPENRLCNVKLSSLFEQGDHERGCWHSTVCPYCGLRFSTPAVKKDHEAHCKYKKLTCLECMRSFKSSFSIWRHQVEVHNQNIMTAKEQLHLRRQEGDAVAENVKDKFFGDGPLTTGSSRQDSYGDSTGPPTYESNKSPCFVPEDLSTGRLLVKEEPMEESVSERENSETASSVLEEPGVWPCEKCGSLFGARKDLERHQELLCHIKPFICHICKKAFRTNFRLWSHFQSHIAAAHEPGPGDFHSQPPPLSPSPPMTLPNAQHPSVLKPSQPAPVAAAAASEEPNSPEESDTLFYHASSLSALAFKRQYMCKICHRTFKTAFSLWSHEQSHS
uniref:Zinc finger and BTB domain containing 21 n=1 Tax=Tetraodon nigroviridis TaxID=99883 RepID=H3CT34_TETNG